MLKQENAILVEGDRNRLNQLFANLLNNAIKFTKKGTISVSIQKKIIMLLLLSKIPVRA
jgi:signal transduction histidine kinase